MVVVQAQIWVLRVDKGENRIAKLIIFLIKADVV